MKYYIYMIIFFLLVCLPDKHVRIPYLSVNEAACAGEHIKKNSRDFTVPFFSRNQQFSGKQVLPEIDPIIAMATKELKWSDAQEQDRFFLPKAEKTDAIVVQIKENKLELVSSPDTLYLTLNHWKAAPLSIRGGKLKQLKITFKGAFQGDQVEIKNGCLIIKTLLAVSHRVSLLLESDSSILEVPLDIEVAIPRLRPFFGLQDHFDRTPPGLSRQALKDIVYMQHLPVQMFRLPLAWPFVERKKGVFNWINLDWYAGAVSQRGGVKILGGLGRVPSWRGKVRDLAVDRDMLSDFKKMTTGIVRHYADSVDYWAIGNEPLGFWWPQYIRQTPEKYIKECGPALLTLIKETSRIIRKEDPSALILSPGFVDRARKPYREVNNKQVLNPAYAMLEWLLDSDMGLYIDALNLHNYPTFKKNNGRLYPLKNKYLNRWQKFDQAVDSSEVLRLLKDHNLKLPVWVTEFGGFRLGEKPGKDEFRRQALAVLRSAAIIAHQNGEGIFFFEMYDYSHVNDIMDSYLMLNGDHLELSAFNAYRHIIRALTGSLSFSSERFKNSKVIDADYSGLVYKMFTRPAEDIICLWSNSINSVKLRFDMAENKSGFYPDFKIKHWSPKDEIIFFSRTPVEKNGRRSVTLQLQPFDFLIITAAGYDTGFKWLAALECEDTAAAMDKQDLFIQVKDPALIHPKTATARDPSG